MSVKDSDFAKANTLDENTKVAVVQDNVNKLITAAQLLSYITSNLDIEDMTLTIPGWEEGTGSLSNLLARLYTLAKNTDGGGSSAEDIEYGNPAYQDVANVGAALNRIIDELAEKIDLIDVAGTPRIDPTQMPIITLHNVVPASECPIITGSGMWFDQDHKLQYRDSSTVPPVDIEIGTPADMLYYHKGFAYKYNYKKAEFEKVGDIDLSNYVAKTDTGRIDYSVLPYVVLTSMDTPGQSMLNSSDEFCYYNSKTRSIKHHKADGTIVEFTPQYGVIYYDLSSESFLIWSDGGGENPWKVIGSTQSAEGKADLLNDSSVEMLKPTQWPQVVINNIDETEYDYDNNGGSIGYNPETKHLYIVKYDDELNPANVDLGMPQEGTIYCLKATNALYRWTGSEYDGGPWQLISSGGGDGSMNAVIEDESIILGASSGGGGGNTPSPVVTSGAGCFVVDLAKYSITEGMMYKENGHYTDKQYDKMYDNATGFTKAFQDAFTNGYSKIVIPKGNYCFTPIFYVNDNNNTMGIDGTPPIIWILNMSNLDIDMAGSTFHLLVDSTQHSKYYNSTEASYAYRGAVIAISQSKNITIRNGNFVGDCYTRSYINSKEKLQESCYGISVGLTGFTYNINLIDLDGSGFSGDFIFCQARSVYLYRQPFWNSRLVGSANGNLTVGPSTSVSGIMNYGFGFTYSGSNDIIIVDNKKSNIKYGLSGVHDLSNWFGNSYSNYPYVLKEAAAREFSIHNSGKYTRMLNCYAPHIQVLTYAELPATPSTLPLRIISTGYCESFQLFENEKYIRLQFQNERGLETNYYRSSGLEDLDAVNAYFGTELSADQTNAPNTAVYDDEDSEKNPYIETDQQSDDDAWEDVTYNNSDAGGDGPRIHIVPKLSGGLLIEGCRIHDNGRGGITGGCNDVIVRDCEFMKQQYDKTSSAQGAHPVFTGGSTNYHIGYEDSVANHLTVENCVFYSGRSTGKLLFPTILRLDFRNNICYGCCPSVGNNFITNITNNVFHRTGIAPTYRNWLAGVAQSSSKMQMTRLMNYTNNVYHNCSAPSYGAFINTVQKITNCQIDINDEYGVTPESTKSFMSGAKQTRTFENCDIKFITPTCSAYFSYLKNCRITGGTAWQVGRIEDCELNNSAFIIVGSTDSAEDNAVHMYVKNVRGMDFRCRCLPPSTMHLTEEDGAIQNKRLDYVVHYDGCEININRVSSDLLSYNYRATAKFYWYESARWYRNIRHEFKNCVFKGSAPVTQNPQNVITFSTIADISSRFYHDLTNGKYYYTSDPVPAADSVVSIKTGNSFDYDNLEKCGIAYTVTMDEVSGLHTEEGHDVESGSISITNPHSSYMNFTDCVFDLSSEVLFNGILGAKHRYFEFSNCSFNPENLKLGNCVFNGVNYQIPCGGLSGSTNDRPKLTSKGSMYYDTMLNKPVWRFTDALPLSDIAQVEFKDATGTTV